jgi:hypothetical protein
MVDRTRSQNTNVMRHAQNGSLDTGYYQTFHCGSKHVCVLYMAAD